MMKLLSIKLYIKATEGTVPVNLRVTPDGATYYAVDLGTSLDPEDYGRATGGMQKLAVEAVKPQRDCECSEGGVIRRQALA